jgi:phage terminase small subunit
MTDKQEIAVTNYCLKGIKNRDIGYSWSQAMRDAGFREGYIDKNAHLLRDKPEIKAAIEKEKAKYREKLTLEADDVINELILIGFSNIEDYVKVNEDGEMHIRGFKGIDRAKLAAIESIKVNTTKNKDKQGNIEREYETTQFKLCSKLNALEQLGKHFGIYQADNEQQRDQSELTEAQREEAIQIAEWRLKQGVGGSESQQEAKTA